MKTGKTRKTKASNVFYIENENGLGYCMFTATAAKPYFLEYRWLTSTNKPFGFQTIDDAQLFLSNWNLTGIIKPINEFNPKYLANKKVNKHGKISIPSLE